MKGHDYRNRKRGRALISRPDQGRILHIAQISCADCRMRFQEHNHARLAREAEARPIGGLFGEAA